MDFSCTLYKLQNSGICTWYYQKESSDSSRKLTRQMFIPGVGTRRPLAPLLEEMICGQAPNGRPAVFSQLGPLFFIPMGPCNFADWIQSRRVGDFATTAGSEPNNIACIVVKRHFRGPKLDPATLWHSNQRAENAA